MLGRTRPGARGPPSRPPLVCPRRPHAGRRGRHPSSLEPSDLTGRQSLQAARRPLPRGLLVAPFHPSPALRGRGECAREGPATSSLRARVLRLRVPGVLWYPGNDQARLLLSISTFGAWARTLDGQVRAPSAACSPGSPLPSWPLACESGPGVHPAAGGQFPPPRRHHGRAHVPSWSPPGARPVGPARCGTQAAGSPWPQCPARPQEPWCSARGQASRGR